MIIKDRFKNLNELKTAYKNGYCYVYSQHSSWFESTKINIHYGIWKRIKKNHPDNLFITMKDEPRHNENGQLKCFGLAEIKISDMDYVINNFAGDFDNCLFLSTRKFDVLYDLFSDNFIGKLINADFFCFKSKISTLSNVLSSEEVIVTPNYINKGYLIPEIIEIDKHVTFNKKFNISA